MGTHGANPAAIAIMEGHHQWLFLCPPFSSLSSLPRHIAEVASLLLAYPLPLTSLAFRFPELAVLLFCRARWSSIEVIGHSLAGSSCPCSLTAWAILQIMVTPPASPALGLQGSFGALSWLPPVVLPMGNMHPRNA